MPRLAVPVLALFGAACITSPTNEILGVSPAPGFSDAGSPEFGVASVFLQGTEAESTVRCEGLTCEPIDIGTRPGHQMGVFAVLVDASGSNEVAQPGDCTGCPTDPERRRELAVRVFLSTLLTQAPGWTGAVLDFGPRSSAGFRVSRMLAGYSSDLADLSAGTAQLTSSGGTPLYEAAWEVLPSIAAERDFRLLDPTAGGARLLVLSDGEDTTSYVKLQEVLDRARMLNITIDAVGFGAPSDAGTPLLHPKAHRDLRRLAFETGGFVAIVTRDELPDLFRRIADSYSRGLTETRFRVAPAPTSQGAMVRGEVEIAGQAAAAPFSFEAHP